LSDFGWGGRGRDDDGLRKSLHHTARGPMPVGAWVRLPAARLRARLGRHPERPWIVPAAIGWLGRRMRRDWSVLELGSGRSTVWLAKRSSRVTSFEDNEHWVERAREQLQAAGVENAELRQLPIERFVPEVAALPDDSYDLVVVDFLESPEAERVEAVRAARAKVRPGGYLLLDDSDRPAYAGAFELLDGWHRRRFAGVKDAWPQAVETTIFRRPR
jgi:predicted O-methyltransferase YrrM